MCKLVDTRKLTLAVSSLAAAGLAAGAVGASSADAAGGGEFFCITSLKSNESCSGKWHHLIRVFGESPGHTVCVDAYLDPKNNPHYSSEHCKSEGAEFSISSEWGYPRIWPKNSGGNVLGWEEWGTNG